MEKLDRRILALLARDGRMSYTDIGKETGLSTSAAQQRVRRLEQRGVIKGYTAVLDSAELGLLVTAFVAIKPFDPSQPDDAPDRLQHIEEIISCYSVAGDPSYLLKVQVPDDGHLESLLARIRADGKVSTHTTTVLSIPYEDRPAALTGELPSDRRCAVIFTGGRIYAAGQRRDDARGHRGRRSRRQDHLRRRRRGRPPILPAGRGSRSCVAGW